MITTNIQTANFRATLTDNGSFSFKALTPMAKAYFNLKGIKNGTLASYSNDDFLLQYLAQLESGVAKLAQI